MSQTQEFAPTITAFKPTIGTAGAYTPAGTSILPTLSSQVNGYSHTLQANGGYWSARFSINLNQRELEEWVIGGVGRHIEVTDNAGVIIFEGFVNKVTSNLGVNQTVVGPLMDVGNDVTNTYARVITTVDPPIFGAEARLNSTDANSIARYGIWPLVINGGDQSDTNAASDLADFIAENAVPKVSKSVTGGSGSDPRITVEVLGYVHLLDKYIYNDIVSTGLGNLSDKIQSIITAQNNTILDTTFVNITANATQVPLYENDNKKSWGLIKSLVALGDATAARYLFGVYAGFMPVYEAAPTTLLYQQQLSDPEQKVTYLDGGRVLPWHVLPGKWLTFSDFLTGESEPADLRDDPRAMFIESVTFTAPWGLAMQGGKVDTFAQKLARKGLGTVAS
jgi:hypothetical protein